MEVVVEVVHRRMRGINIGGMTECKAFKHFGEEHYYMSTRIRPKILGGRGGWSPSSPPFYAYVVHGGGGDVVFTDGTVDACSVCSHKGFCNASLQSELRQVKL